MEQDLKDSDLEIFERKEAERERDRQIVATGAASFEGMSHGNALASSVIEFYQPDEKPGLPR